MDEKYKQAAKQKRALRLIKKAEKLLSEAKKCVEAGDFSRARGAISDASEAGEQAQAHLDESLSDFLDRNHKELKEQGII